MSESEESCKVCGKPSGYEAWCSNDCFIVLCTCSVCDLEHKCPYAYDEYNTNGDCLAEK